jgi:tetratricopeptide (TPR) repeat protein
VTATKTAPSGLLPALLVLAAVIAYANSLNNPFVFDDLASIVENRHIRQLWPPSVSLGAPQQATVAGRPVVSLSLALNYAVGGLSVRGYHLTNLAIHILCGLLLYGVVRRTLRTQRVASRFRARADGIAFACSLLWLVHPLGTELINYVVQRTESIMALFYLLTLYAAIRAVDGSRAVSWIVLATVACALGMASKESMVTAPVAVLLHDWLFLPGNGPDRLKRRRKLYLGLGASWLVLLAILWTGPRTETVGFDVGISSLEYAKNQCVVVVEYLRSALWPHPLVFDFGDARPLATATAVPYALFLALLVVAGGALLLRRLPLAYPAVWLFLVLAPTSTVVPIASEVGAERRMYLPLAGLVVLLTLAAVQIADRLLRRAVWVRTVTLVLLALSVTTLTVGTRLRNHDYRSNVTIWESAVVVRPDNPRAHNNLGQAQQVAGNGAEAVASYERALELDPGYGRAHFNLGVTLAEAGRTDEAMARYRRALELTPELEQAHHNLASELANRGRLDEAIMHFREAVRLAPESAIGRQNLGRALRLSGDAAQALVELRVALRLEPAGVDTLGDIAWILATHPDPGLRDADEALLLARRAVELTGGDHAVSLDTLAASLASAGRFEEALQRGRQALETALRNGVPELATEIRMRLELFERGEAYHEPAGIRGPR